MRHCGSLYHSATRMIEVGFYSIQRRRNPKNWRKQSLPRQARRSRRPWLIHYHIFKNAGTSFEWTLNESFRKSVRSYDPSSPEGFFSPAQIASYVRRNPRVKVLVTHQAILLPPRIRGCTCISSILIRDPLARVRSIYAFERQQEANNVGAKKAKELDFKGYVEWRLSCSAGMFCNYQVYYCSRRKHSSPNDIMTEDHLERAIENLDRIDIVGTVERYAQWLALTQSVLNEAFPKIDLVVTRQNATEAASLVSHTSILENLMKDLGSELAERLLQCNHLDMCLHQVADGLLTRQLAERRVDITLLDAYATASRLIASDAKKTDATN